MKLRDKFGWSIRGYEAYKESNPHQKFKRLLIDTDISVTWKLRNEDPQKEIDDDRMFCEKFVELTQSMKNIAEELKAKNVDLTYRETPQGAQLIAGDK